MSNDDSELFIPSSMEDVGELGVALAYPASRSAPQFLTNLAEVARRTGFPVVEWAGWQTRTRGGDSQGYRSGSPNHIMVHHTASGPASDGRGDATFIWNNASTRPIYNVYISRDGTIYVGAGGPSNNAGNGSTSSRDGRAAWDGQGVPDNAMNSWSIAVALANTGTGEPYPTRQTDALVAFCRAAMPVYSIENTRVRGHAEWTHRKIDNAGPSPWANGTNIWNFDLFRRDLAGIAPPPPLPPTNPSGDDEKMLYVMNLNGTGAIWIGDGITRRHIGNEDEFGALRWNLAVNGRPFRDFRTGLVNPDINQISAADDASLAALGSLH